MLAAVPSARVALTTAGLLLVSMFTSAPRSVTVPVVVTVAPELIESVPMPLSPVSAAVRSALPT